MIEVLKLAEISVKFIKIKGYNNYVALYELQELKICQKPQNKHRKKPSQKT